MPLLKNYNNYYQMLDMLILYLFKKRIKKEAKSLVGTKKISTFAPALEQKFTHKLRIKQIKKTLKKVEKRFG